MRWEILLNAVQYPQLVRRHLVVVNPSWQPRFKAGNQYMSGAFKKVTLTFVPSMEIT